jgi:hypothetical protein
MPTGVISPKTVPMQKYNTNEENMDKNAAMSVALMMPYRRTKLRNTIPFFTLHKESPNIQPLQSQNHHG